MPYPVDKCSEMFYIFQFGGSYFINNMYDNINSYNNFIKVKTSVGPDIGCFFIFYFPVIDSCLYLSGVNLPGPLLKQTFGFVSENLIHTCNLL